MGNTHIGKVNCDKHICNTLVYVDTRTNHKTTDVKKSPCDKMISHKHTQNCLFSTISWCLQKFSVHIKLLLIICRHY